MQNLMKTNEYKASGDKQKQVSEWRVTRFQKSRSTQQTGKPVSRRASCPVEPRQKGAHTDTHKHGISLHDHKAPLQGRTHILVGLGPSAL